MALGVSAAFITLFTRIIYLQVGACARGVRGDPAQENIVKTLDPARHPRRDPRSARARHRLQSSRLSHVRHTIAPARAEDIARIQELLGLDDKGKAAFEASSPKVPERRRTHQIQMLGELYPRAAGGARDPRARATRGRRGAACPCAATHFGKLAAHAIGYLNEISGEELEQLKDLGYRAGDRGRPQRHRARLGSVPARTARLPPGLRGCARSPLAHQDP